MSRRRNREVNIFNMSLLDILCGALGAFCFMMLSLFPDHAKVKELQARLQAAEKNSTPSDVRNMQQAQQRIQQLQKDLDQAKADQSLLWFRVAWDGGQDIDMYIATTSGKLCSSKPELIPPEKSGGKDCKFNDKTKGPTYEQGWFSDIAYNGASYRLFARLQNRNGVPGPATAHGYMIARTPAEGGQAMHMVDLGTVSLPNERGELVELGYIEFGKLGFTITPGAKPNAERPMVRFDQPAGVRFNPPARAGQELERVDQWH